MKSLNFKKNSKIWLTWFLVAVFFSSCTVLSFYPFYTKDVLKLDSRITGKWLAIQNEDGESDTLIWQIEYLKPKKDKPKKEQDAFLYRLNVSRKQTPEKVFRFDVHIMEIKGQVFMDFFPENWDLDNDMIEMHLMSMHSLAKVKIRETLNINWMDSEWFDDMMKENRIRIRHEKNNINTLLTAKSEDLVKFVEKYGNDPAAWEDGLNYNLIRIEEQPLVQ